MLKNDGKMIRKRSRTAGERIHKRREKLRKHNGKRRKRSAIGGRITGAAGFLCVLLWTLISAFTSFKERGAETGENVPGAGSTGIEAVDTEVMAGDNCMRVHFLDVGQGDCTLIESGGHFMLIDAGNNDKGTLVWNYLQKQGVEALDYVIGTHPDADHIGGLDVILYKFDCETVILPEVSNDTRTYDDVVQTMENKGYVATAPIVGETYALGNASFTIIAPNADYGKELNDWSVGILLENGENRFLFTGDAGETAEADILANGIPVLADVYKVAHHGSRTATSEAFLKAVNPSYAVISVGEGNSYGHPSAEVLNRLRSAGVEVFRTDEQGTVIAETDGTRITWNCMPSESWQAGETDYY